LRMFRGLVVSFFLFLFCLEVEEEEGGREGGRCGVGWVVLSGLMWAVGKRDLDEVMMFEEILIRKGRWSGCGTCGCVLFCVEEEFVGDVWEDGWWEGGVES
jgi:hypothetical protein